MEEEENMCLKVAGNIEQQLPESVWQDCHGRLILRGQKVAHHICQNLYKRI